MRATRASVDSTLTLEDMFLLAWSPAELGARSQLDLDVPARLGCAVRLGALPLGRGRGRVEVFKTPRGGGGVI